MPVKKPSTTKIELIHKNGDHPATPPKHKLSFGARASDQLTEAMGSWTFIIWFAFFLMLWMALNFFAWSHQWDPYPFILLNLFLSSLATFQAPIIMMSQNRQTERDRQTAKYDYAVNRKAEREIQDLQKGIDKLQRMISKLEKK